MLKLPVDFFYREDGATTSEYAILVGLIALVIFAAVTLVGVQVNGLFNLAATLIVVP